MKARPFILAINYRMLTGFIAAIRAMGYQPTTVVNYHRIVEEFMGYLGNISIDSVVISTLEGYLDYLGSRRNLIYGGSLSTSSLNRHLSVLRMLSIYLQESHGITVPLYLPSLYYDPQPRRYLTTVEIRMLYDQLADGPCGLLDRALLDLYYGCGLRANEGIMLETTDLSFESNLLTVSKGKHYTVRHVPMGSSVVNGLSDYLRYGRKHFAVDGLSENAFLLGVKGARMSYGTARKRLLSLAEQSGVDPFGLHALRHSIATHLLSSGMGLEQVATFLGHKSLQTTQHYTHLGEDGAV